MTQTVKRPTKQQPAHELHDTLQLRYEDTYTVLRREEAVVQAMRTSIDEGPGDEVDHATVRAQLDEQVTLTTTLQSQLDDLASAMARFDAGTYGVCERCGQPIPAERMELFPAATHCVACKTALERR